MVVAIVVETGFPPASAEGPAAVETPGNCPRRGGTSSAPGDAGRPGGRGKLAIACSDCDDLGRMPPGAPCIPSKAEPAPSCVRWRAMVLEVGAVEFQAFMT
ncbi:hypothetical protein [Caldimonas brevitalea]|uniref:hypothetical protein n=1 Tax=Caldimonas brevitalea TaxID=413882 RepID=UPI0012F891FD|nr:hypothetical protein [Caldimonas brevitalea]